MTDSQSTEDLLASVLASEGEAYLRAERRLLEVASTDTLRTIAASHKDPLADLVANVAAWHDEAPSQVDEVDRYLGGAERWFHGKVRPTPPVHGVVEALSTRFGPRLADLLALRLVQMPNAANWRTLTALEFLKRHPSPAATDALIRFASTTAVPHLQNVAARVLSAIPDPAFAQKLEAERQRLAQAGRSLPGPLAGLRGVSA